jgi:transaldolase
MKIFLDTAHVESIQKFLAMGLIDGITTNPSLLSKEGNDPRKTVESICALLPHGEISVEITETDPNKVYAQAKKIAQIAKNIIVKIPCHAMYYSVIDKLVQEKILLNITLVFTLMQGFMMAKLGVHYISPFIGRWDDLGIATPTLFSDLRRMIDCNHYKTHILAASLRQVDHVNKAVLAGVDAVTMSVSLFERVTEHPLTNLGIKKFEADWKILNLSQFP